jgi:hypothetical protein
LMLDGKEIAKSTADYVNNGRVRIRLTT